jgi:hypothetical protein
MEIRRQAIVLLAYVPLKSSVEFGSDKKYLDFPHHIARSSTEFH